MSGRVRVLDPALADQIAAGEVVERPSSVVRELVENAIDAGATQLTIEIEDGGVQLVRVTDDGSGMSPEDAALSVRRHATSKLSRVEDLLAITTLGFRGEALPSIASVSKFVLTTRTRDRVEGTRVEIVGGGEPRVSPCGAPPGTSVEVRELFHNVPARRKFLKTQATESSQIVQVVLDEALARPGIRFVLRRDGKTWRELLPQADHEARARSVFPDEALRRLEGARDGVKVLALLGAPERARSGTGSLHVFVNGRAVRERTLLNAVRYAYGSVLPGGRYPAGVVHVELDPAEVDVNVHPQKAEVRFARGRVVPDALTKVLAAKLGTQAWGGAPGPAARGEAFWQERLGGAFAGVGTARADAAGRDASGSDGVSIPYASVGERPDAQPGLFAAESPRGALAGLRVLGQVRKMLLVCESDGALVVLDQHAADERVRYHRLRAEYAAKAVRTQRLLLPERVEVTATEAALLDEAREEVLRAGVDCSRIGPSTMAVHAVPALLGRAPPARLLRDLVTELGRAGERGFGDALDMALATMACHGAIRAGDPLSLEECSALLRALDEVTDFAGHCPHGRPIVYAIPFGELERRLGR